ncbi:MAG TPA: OmpA family protein [Puia sp.]|jgi:OOP family OmpA-OmpF porin|nr:OmpA family protein [Puia sp.]
MNKKLLIGFATCILFSIADGQVNNPGQVANDAATNQVNNDMNNAANNGVNKAEKSIEGVFKKKNKPAKTDSSQSKQNATQHANGTTTAVASQGPSLQAYDNYDFVPGEKIFFTDDFADDQKGEFPAHWHLCYGQGVATNFDGKKVFALTEGEHGDNAVVMEPRMKKKSGYMPANFTVEFDMYVPRTVDADDDIRGHWAGINFYGTDELIDSYNDLSISPERLEFYTSLISEGSKQIPDGLNNENFCNKWHHVAIAYKNKQMKVYLDQNRLFVVPEVKDAGINKFGIRVTGKCVVTNIRLAEGGGMNMLGQKFTDAKIVTHGINFDVDKSTIKPESMGTLNMIVQIMKDNPDIKFDVEGFTDNSGDPAHNLTLSQNRADAVKVQLISMGISASRLTSKGYGETKPISDNNSPEGKANNRRVEFVKI